MNGNNGFFQRMCKEAADELAQGDRGWKDMDSNTLTMACFHYLFNHMTHKITRPLWFAAGAVTTWAVGSLLQSFVFGG